MNDHDAWVLDSFEGDEEDDEYWNEREEIEFDRYEQECEMTNKLNLTKALKDLEKQQEVVAKLLKQTQRFPEEFPVGTVLKFKHVFENSSYVRNVRANGGEPIAYDYVALRANNGFWYLTCNGSKTMNWEQLVEFIGDEGVTMMVEGETI